MADYIYQRDDWPNFHWDSERIAAPLAAVSRRQGKFSGRMEALGFQLRAEATLETLTEDVLKSSEIEGEILDKDQVRSSIAQRLGMDIGALSPADRHVDGVVEMVLDATQNFAEPLTTERLWGWHAALFPTGRSGMTKIIVGAWRDERSGPMQVVSGPYGKERIHYEAPGHEGLDREISQFLEWFEAKDPFDPVLRAAIAHLWFVTLHPFDDGNGRIARAIADLALARAEASPQRFYSLSSQIRGERKTYYDLLEATQKGDLDITPWLDWFLACLNRALDNADTVLASVLNKARFWNSWATRSFNARQKKILNRLLDGFEGKLNTSKWAAITKVSTDTALRDIEDLVTRGVLSKEQAGGRSTHYSLVKTSAD